MVLFSAVYDTLYRYFTGILFSRCGVVSYMQFIITIGVKFDVEVASIEVRNISDFNFSETVRISYFGVFFVVIWIIRIASHFSFFYCLLSAMPYICQFNYSDICAMHSLSWLNFFACTAFSLLDKLFSRKSWRQNRFESSSFIHSDYKRNYCLSSKTRSSPSAPSIHLPEFWMQECKFLWSASQSTTSLFNTYVVTP